MIVRNIDNTEAAVSLRRLRRGESAVIAAITHQAVSIQQKYAARGIVPGALVSMLHQGDPVVIALDDSRWAIDGDEAEHIDVFPIVAGLRNSWFGRAIRALRRCKADA